MTATFKLGITATGNGTHPQGYHNQGTGDTASVGNGSTQYLNACLVGDRIRVVRAGTEPAAHATAISTDASAPSITVTQYDGDGVSVKESHAISPGSSASFSDTRWGDSFVVA